MTSTKLLPVAALFLPWAALPLSADEAAPTSPPVARILGELPDGTPPPPAPRQPVLDIHPSNILETRVRQDGEAFLTIQKVAPLELPPVSTPELVEDNHSAPQGVMSAPERVKSQLLLLSATVHEFSDQPNRPRTLLRFWPQPGEEPVVLWANANFLWLTGFASFQDASGTQHSFSMAISAEKKQRRDEFHPGPGIPAIPEFLDETKASFVVVGGNPTTEQLTPISTLLEIYNTDLDRLKTAYEGRERARLEREAYLKANPPKPKNLTLRYWRVDEAGREGVEPQPVNVR